MKRFLFASLALVALPLLAQAPQSTPDAEKPVAVINGEVITAGQLDRLYDGIGALVREQYAKNGGKPAFLENYIRKRLVIQEAMKTGYDKRPDVQAELDAARESALFDRYVRDIVATPIVTGSEIAQYYKDHPDDFSTPEQVRVRHIVVGPRSQSREEALEQIQKVLAGLRTQNDAIRFSEPAATQMRVHNFAEMARQYSQDASAESGGDLGWVSRGQLDPTFEEAAFQMQKGKLSGVIQTNFGYHIIFIEDKRAAGMEPFDQVKASIREFLLNQRTADVVNAVSKLTNELRANSKIALHPENIK